MIVSCKSQIKYLHELFEASEKINNEDIIPDDNKKSFDWLKKEFNKTKVESDCDITVGNNSFKLEYDMQAKLDGVKEFKPGMFGLKSKPEVTDGKVSDFKPTTYGNNNSKQSKSEFGEMFTKKDNDDIKTDSTDNESKNEDSNDSNINTKSVKDDSKEKDKFSFDLRRKKE